MNNILVSIDLNCSRFTQNAYNLLINTIYEKHKDDNIIYHYYNYIDKKHTGIYIDKNTYLHNYKGSHKKISLDIYQALDCVDLYYKKNIKTIYILCGEYESENLYSKLEEMKINTKKIKISPTSICINDEFLLVNEKTNELNINKDTTRLQLENNQSELVKNIEINTKKNTENTKQNNINLSKLSDENLKAILRYILDKKLDLSNKSKDILCEKLSV